MRKFSTKAKLSASIIIIAIMALFNYGFLFFTESSEHILYSKLLEQNSEFIRSSQYLIKNFETKKDAEIFNDFTNRVQQLQANYKMLENGGFVTINAKRFTITPIQNKKLLNQLKEIQLDFEQLFDNLEPFGTKNDKGLITVPGFWNDEHKRALKTIQANLDDINTKNQYLSMELSNVTENKEWWRELISVVTIFFILVFSLITFWLSRLNIFKQLGLLIHHANQIAQGKTTQKYSKVKGLEFKRIEAELNQISHKINEATSFAKNIGEGQFDTTFKEIGEDDSLAQSLTDMRDRLKEISEQEKKRNWSINGLAKFSELVRNNLNKTIEELSYAFIRDLVKYLEANQGGVFIINEDENADEPFIELTAAYAYEKRKYLQKRLKMKEGLVGQCILEKQSIYQQKIPDNYVKITSGLGEATPRVLVVVPILVNDQVYGAIEIASFKKFAPYQISFIEEVCESIGSTISGIKINQRTQKLLQASQNTNEELAAKEEQMRQNAEELNTTQEELNRKLRELEIETNLTNCIIEAINKTNATIEFDLEGNILEINDMYLSVMGYRKEELIGRNEKELVTQDELNTQRYQLMWDSLKTGSFHAGEYRRLSKEGKEIWLNGTYNTIIDIEGKPYKVIQFAQFTTEEKERELDLTSKINALSSTFPLIDLDIKGYTISANQVFVKLTKYKRVQLRNKNFVEILAQDAECQNTFRNVWEEVLQGLSQSVNLKIATKEGEEKHVLTILSPTKNLSGEIYKVQTIMIDVTEEKSLQLQLSEKQSILEQTISELQQTQTTIQKQKSELESRINMLNKAAMIFELDNKFRFTFANDELSENLKLPAKRLQKTPIDIVLDSNTDDEMNALKENLRHGKIERITLKWGAKDSGFFWGETTIAPLTTKENDEPYKYVGLLIDVTQQVKEKSELEESLSREKLKNSFFRNNSETKQSKTKHQFDELIEQFEKQEKIDIDEIVNNNLLPTLVVDDQLMVKSHNDLAAQLTKIADWGPNLHLDAVVSFGDKQAELFKKLLQGVVVETDASILVKGGKPKNTRIATLPVFADGLKTIVFVF